MNSGPFKTSNLTIPDNFSVNENHLGPSRRLPTKRENKNPKFWHFLQGGPPCQHINGSKIWPRLEWSWSGYDLATIKPKTTSLNLSRNFRSNSGTGKNPAKCFQPETSKSPCIWLGNENGQNKMSSNGPKSMQNPLIHHHWPFQTTSQSTKAIRDPNRGFRPKKKKSQILSFSSSDKDRPRLNCQRQPRLKLTRTVTPHMEHLAWAKRFHNKSWKTAELISRS